MIKWPAILFLLFLSLPALSQRTIKGRVVNVANGAAIPGSSVFITNTSKGTVSDASGNFELTDVPSGKHELVISSIGYETTVYPFSDAELPLRLRVELKIKVKELQNVTVEPYVEEGWDKWGNTFKENFLGYTANAKRCRINNEWSIRFRYFKKSDRLIAFSDVPIEIENKALGYRITYQLEDFEINFKEGLSVFMGYSLYEELDKDKKKWARKREEAYNGSLMHFIRSLYADSLHENGFEMRRLFKVPNEEKQRVKNIYPVTHSSAIAGGTFVITQPKDGLHPDSTAYYRGVLRQPDFLELYGKDLLTADSVIVKRDGDYKLFYWENYLFITYKNELEDAAFLQSKMQMRSPYHQRSSLYLPELNPLWIERNGNYYNPRDMFFMGYWGWSDKMGDSLPLDYQPGK
ncbi:MAG TPA: carboxypeptidase-like regulatory domain-containing protein [Chitinophagaceae bacterium]